MLIGYARVSTKDQNLDRQIDALKAAGCEWIFSDKLSGKNADRPELARALDVCRTGDVLVVAETYRVLARSLADLLNVVNDLTTRGILFKPLDLPSLDTSTPMGECIMSVFGAFGQFQRRMLVQGTHEGLAAARARGRTGGRPRALTPEQIDNARILIAAGKTQTSIAKGLSVSRWTLRRALENDSGQ